MKLSRSREGAWIEIDSATATIAPSVVAPARERGLKSHCTYYSPISVSRSREGAWIEIAQISEIESKKAGRSREGAWIEMNIFMVLLLKKLCRSREGAWIEISPSAILARSIIVAPARERGLKY